MSLLAAFLIGLVAGLRTFTAPAAVSWAAHLGWLHLEGTPLAFFGYAITPWIFTILALVELVGDQLPMQFGARIVSGALCGAAVGLSAGSWIVGLIAGIVGAVAGTLGGHEARRRLAGMFGKDLPAALLEDAIAILAALWIVASLT
jgi:uncharacterized membrane protein